MRGFHILGQKVKIRNKNMSILMMILGSFLFIIGLVFILSPFPVGWVFISCGMIILIPYSEWFKNIINKLLSKYPKIKDKLPNIILRKL